MTIWELPVTFMILLRAFDFKLIKEDPEHSEFLYASEFLKQNFNRVPMMVERPKRSIEFRNIVTEK